MCVRVRLYFAVWHDARKTCKVFDDTQYYNNTIKEEKTHKQLIASLIYWTMQSSDKYLIFSSCLRFILSLSHAFSRPLHLYAYTSTKVTDWSSMMSLTWYVSEQQCSRNFFSFTWLYGYVTKELHSLTTSYATQILMNRFFFVLKKDIII